MGDVSFSLYISSKKGGNAYLMVVVHRSRTESADSIWRKFGKINYEENLVDELRERKYYKKPSIIKKEMLKHRPSHKKMDGGAIRRAKPVQTRGRGRMGKPSR